MKFGVVRKPDHLGRIVIPIDIRHKLGVTMDTRFEVFAVDDRTVVLQKLDDQCAFCGSLDNLLMFKENFICTKCVQELKERK